MKKFLLLPLLLAAGALNAATILRGPYVEDPAPTTTIIKWTTDEQTPAWVEYGPDGKCSQLMALSPEGTEHTLTLHGLIPNTKFCYKIYVQNADGTGVQEPVEGAFQTLFSPERKIVNFLVTGNTSAPVIEEGKQTASAIKAALAAAMAGHAADFMVHTGNIAADGTASGTDTDFFNPFKDLLKKTPLLVALGEDEFGPNRYDAAAGRGFLTANYRRLHTMPWSRGTPSYYYIDTANARLIFLDTNAAFDAPNASRLDNKSPQFEWLKTALSSAGTGVWKIVVLHHPVYSSGPTPDRLSELLAPLFEAQRVNLVIQGAQGAYERTTPIIKAEPAKNGPTYITVAGAGKKYEPRMYTNEWTGKYYDVPHFAHVQIVDRKLSLRVYTHENKRIDALDIHF